MIVELKPKAEQKHIGGGNTTVIETGITIKDYTEAEKKFVIDQWLKEFNGTYPNSVLVNGFIEIKKTTVSTTDPTFPLSCHELQKNLEDWVAKLKDTLKTKAEWLSLKQDIIDLNKTLDEHDFKVRVLEDKLTRLVDTLRDKLGKGIFGKQIIPSDF